MLLVVLFAGCHRGEIRIPLTDAPNSPIVWRKKLDCDIFAEKTNTLRLSLDTTFFPGVRAGPAVEFGKSVKQKWNSNVNTVNVIYRGLCNDWNSGLLSLQRFSKKRDDIDKLYETLSKESGFRDEVGEYWGKQADRMFAELDAELQKKVAREDQEFFAAMDTKLDEADSKFKAQLATIEK